MPLSLLIPIAKDLDRHSGNVGPQPNLRISALVGWAVAQQPRFSLVNVQCRWYNFALLEWTAHTPCGPKISGALPGAQVRASALERGRTIRVKYRSVREQLTRIRGGVARPRLGHF